MTRTTRLTRSRARYERRDCLRWVAYFETRSFEGGVAACSGVELQCRRVSWKMEVVCSRSEV